MLVFLYFWPSRKVLGLLSGTMLVYLPSMLSFVFHLRLDICDFVLPLRVMFCSLQTHITNYIYLRNLSLLSTTLLYKEGPVEVLDYSLVWIYIPSVAGCIWWYVKRRFLFVNFNCSIVLWLGCSGSVFI